VSIAFHEWAACLKDAWKAASPAEAWNYLTRPPGWSPDGSTLTADQLRARQSAGVFAEAAVVERTA
jgi:hypothetical protein